MPTHKSLLNLMCAGKIINGSLKRNDPVLNHQERKLDREKASASEACVRTQPAGTDTDFGPMQLLPRAEGVSGGLRAYPSATGNTVLCSAEAENQCNAIAREGIYSPGSGFALD